jgi:hypothetical protein
VFEGGCSFSLEPVWATALIMQVIVECFYSVQITVDRLDAQPFLHKVVDVDRHLVVRHLLDGHVYPQNKLLDAVKIVLNGVGRIISSFKIPSKLNDRIGHVHRSPLLQ